MGISLNCFKDSDAEGEPEVNIRAPKRAISTRKSTRAQTSKSSKAVSSISVPAAGRQK